MRETDDESNLASLARVAAICSGVMIANQVAGKATRDAIFLSTFDITDLPLMLIATAAISMVAAFLTTRLFNRFGPAKVVPAAFALSSALLCAWWAAMGSQASVAAIGIYLHLGVFGAILISGFWSLVTERFDPRAAKKRIGRIAAGGTLGGLAGGLIAERVAATLSMSAMLPMLAGTHIVCALLVLRMISGADPESPKASAAASDKPPSGFTVLTEVPYMRNLALLVLLGTVSAGLVDYVFKAEAVAYLGSGESLMRFFAIFYTAVGVATFVVQTTVSKLALERLGLAPVASCVPLTVFAGGLGMLAIPGIGAAALTRALEAVLRSSAFRSAYELLYMPISPRDRRATKTLIDVGFDRFGDALAGGFIRLVLFAVPAIASSVLVAVAVITAGAALFVVRQLHRGYVYMLEQRLVSQGAELDMLEVPAGLNSGGVMQTYADVDLRLVLRAGGASEGMLSRVDTLSGMQIPALKNTAVAQRKMTPSAPRTIQRRDPSVDAIVELRSGEAARIKVVLDSGTHLSAELVPHLIRLLAWKEMSQPAIQALTSIAPRVTGQLLDALLDPNEEFAIRRRLPRILSGCTSERSVFGLVDALADKRFEVRFHTGLALAAIHRRNPEVKIPVSRVHQEVLRETAVDRRVWETHRLLEELGADAGVFFEDELVRQRSNRGLEHVFTLLSLVLPTEPLLIAYRGIHTGDRDLRGTALEYLESVLPKEIRTELWPFLEPSKGDANKASPKDREQALEALLKSNKSIELNLKELRARFVRT